MVAVSLKKKFGGGYAGVDDVDVVVGGLVVVLDIVLDRVANADDPVAFCHDFAVFSDTVKPMYRGDPWEF